MAFFGVSGKRCNCGELGIFPVTPTITYDETPTIAFSFTLPEDYHYTFDARIVLHRLDIDGDSGIFQEVVHVKRDIGGAAVIVSDQYQAVARRTDQNFDVFWATSGNEIRLIVVGASGKTIKWQPQIQSVKVS